MLTSGWLDGAIGSVVLKTAWERDFEITQREHAKNDGFYREKREHDASRNRQKKRENIVQNDRIICLQNAILYVILYKTGASRDENEKGMIKMGELPVVVKSEDGTVIPLIICASNAVRRKETSVKRYRQLTRCSAGCRHRSDDPGEPRRKRKSKQPG